MGNSSSRCCDVVKDKKEEPKNEKKCHETSNLVVLTNHQKSTDQSSDLCPAASKLPDDTLTSLSNTSNNTTAKDLFHTPVNCASVNRNKFAIDPRSPTNGIARTPICYEDKLGAQSKIDPRSPTVGLQRTPIVYGSQPGSLGDYVAVGHNVCDPRSPTSDISRTPLKLCGAGNLRRSVLLSNTLMSSSFTNKLDGPTQNTEEEVFTNSYSLGDGWSHKCENMADLSCASNLNLSLSSTAANAGSEPPSADDLSESITSTMDVDEEIDQFSEGENNFDMPEPHIGYSKLEPTEKKSTNSTLECDVSVQSNSKTYHSCIVSNNESADEANASDIFLEETSVSKKHVKAGEKLVEGSSILEQDEGLPKVFKLDDKSLTDKEQIQEKNEINLKQKSHIPSVTKSSGVVRKRSLSSGHFKSQSMVAAKKEPLSKLDILTAQEHSLHCKNNVENVSAVENNIQRKKMRRDVVGATSVRSPLAVLGHSNSPEPKRLNVRESKSESSQQKTISRTNSRLPRYKGNIANRSRSSSLASALRSTSQNSRGKENC